MSVSLPTVGGSDGTWGTMLNDYILNFTDGSGNVTSVTSGAVSGAGAEMTANKGIASGYAPLNSSSVVPIANIPTGTTSSTVAIGNDSRFAGAAAGTSGAALSATDPTTTNSRTPSGSASGDLTGSYPAPNLVGTSNVEAIIRQQSLDQMTAAAANVAMGNGTNNYRINDMAPGAVATDAATLSQTASWVQDTNAWTYTGSGGLTFTISGNQTATYVKAVRVKWSESGTIKYGVISSSSYSSPNTTVTMVATSDYVMAATPDGSSNYYSSGSPSDFPSFFTWSNNAMTTWTGSPTIAGWWWLVGKTMNLSLYANGTSTTGASVLPGCTLPLAVGSNISGSSNILVGTILAEENSTVVSGFWSANPGASGVNFIKGYNLLSPFWTSGATRTIIAQIILPL